MASKPLTVGERIFNRGDMANVEHFATVEAVKVDRWGTHYHVKTDDGETYTVEAGSVSDADKGHCGTRIVRETAYRERRQRMMGC